MVKRFRDSASSRTWIKVAADSIMIALSFMVALSIRFEFVVPSRYLINFFEVLPAVVILFISVNSLARLYARRWKYASFDELVNLVSASIISTALLVLLIVAIPGARKFVPASVAIAGGILALFTMAFSRLEYRLVTERSLLRTERTGTRVLLVGAGEAGEMIIRDMMRRPGSGYLPVGFIDDDPLKGNLLLKGVPVLGNRFDIPDLAKKHEIDEIFVTMPSVIGEPLREILLYCEKTDAEIKILPSVFMTMTGDIGLASVRELRLEDLLGRDPVETDIESISAYVKDKIVLVTGAGGSIGSELSRQLCMMGPKKLLLLDNDSTHLFDLDSELCCEIIKCPTEVIVADVRDPDRLESIFENQRPQVIFHSAALKHVPMMEHHPSEAVKSNVMGTRNLAELCNKYRAERFILISTDKAVHPANVMGATKRLAEHLVKYFNDLNGTRFTAVRFGNVLGSRGSVVPVFKKQIENGGPVLITDYRMTRYFMTIEEAAQLVIQAGAFTEGGDLFILDMGKPVRIADLALQMIRLLARGKRIDIQEIGLRPGEKLEESLLFQAEEIQSTPHPKIGKAFHEMELPDNFEARIEALVKAAYRDDADEIKSLISDLLPGYHAASMLETAEVEIETVVSVTKK